MGKQLTNESENQNKFHLFDRCRFTKWNIGSNIQKIRTVIRKMYLKKFEVKVASSILNGPLGVESIR